MGNHGTPQMSMYIYHGKLDQVSPVENAEALVENLCAKEAQILFVKDVLSEHVLEPWLHTKEVLAFMEKRFEGVPVRDGCRKESELVPDLVSGLPARIWRAVKSWSCRRFNIFC
ncbi:hypothetical protein AUEXF2481DRAFT_33690 [Aureobasidium subglaciale EXF-2481]|uniref:Peptidase S9 prolyl oligopeptidase catalytic domain-containing protein n=1 Tax=Aureobasidium subglaciale (strain EXF-2481) TaxID=1043005 RepID=A0A074XZ79_AURSE|nr:uncharacterized protein AUEXF2481DRAFT_33690 [Aureobasidium subglaciale EXF-2481]KEQ90745.1 hypothetical protein AUEXF2481DRAFT_33690 [Aureobasidium subglaciale EXF-2481]